MHCTAPRSLLSTGKAATARFPKPTRAITASEYKEYWERGFLNVKSLFSLEEMAVLKAAIEGDKLIDAKRMDMKDATGA